MAQTAARAEYQREYRKRNRERMREQNRKWKQEHPEQVAGYREKDRERARAATKAWKEANPERAAANQARYVAENKEALSVYQARYRQENKLRRSVLNHKRRQQERQGDLTLAQWEAILEEFDHRCAYCQVRGRLQIEHMTPLSRGGEHTAQNVVPACQSCNSRKRARTIFEFLSV